MHMHMHMHMCMHMLYMHMHMCPDTRVCGVYGHGCDVIEGESFGCVCVNFSLVKYVLREKLTDTP